MNNHENHYNPEIEGLNGDQVAQIVESGLGFMRAITEAYGPTRGQELWHTITDALGDEVRGAIFFSMLTGNSGNHVRFSGKAINKINAIKAIRTATGLGLKEAKDLADYAENSPQTVRITDFRSRIVLVAALRGEGMGCQ